VGQVTLRCVCVCVNRYLASGSGDTTVRFWDINTETPHHCCHGCYCVTYLFVVDAQKCGLTFITH